MIVREREEFQLYVYFQSAHHLIKSIVHYNLITAVFYSSSQIVFVILFTYVTSFYHLNVLRTLWWTSIKLHHYNLDLWEMVHLLVSLSIVKGTKALYFSELRALFTKSYLQFCFTRRKMNANSLLSLQINQISWQSCRHQNLNYYFLFTCVYCINLIKKSLRTPAMYENDSRWFSAT